MKLEDEANWRESVFEPHARLSLGVSIRELWAYREVTWSFGMRRIRARYKQAVFGFLWAVVQPLAFLGLFLVFLRPSGGNTKVFAAGTFGALVAWQFINSAISGAGASLLGEAGLLRKVYFPRECVVLGAVGSFLPDLVLNLVCMLGIAPLLGAQFSWYWLLLPVVAAQIVVTSLAVSMPLAALTVYYRDFLYALPFVVQLWFFATPVAYTVDRVGHRWQWLYALVNPMVGPAAAFRSIVASGDAPPWQLLGCSAASGLVVLLVGYRWFKSLEREFAEAV